MYCYTILLCTAVCLRCCVYLEEQHVLRAEPIPNTAAAAAATVAVAAASAVDKSRRRRTTTGEAAFRHGFGSGAAVRCEIDMGRHLGQSG